MNVMGQAFVINKSDDQFSEASSNDAPNVGTTMLAVIGGETTSYMVSLLFTHTHTHTQREREREENIAIIHFVS